MEPHSSPQAASLCKSGLHSVRPENTASYGTPAFKLLWPQSTAKTCFTSQLYTHTYARHRTEQSEWPYLTEPYQVYWALIFHFIPFCKKNCWSWPTEFFLIHQRVTTRSLKNSTAGQWSSMGYRYPWGCTEIFQGFIDTYCFKGINFLSLNVHKHSSLEQSGVWAQIIRAYLPFFNSLPPLNKRQAFCPP